MQCGWWLWREARCSAGTNSPLQRGCPPGTVGAPSTRSSLSAPHRSASPSCTRRRRRPRGSTPRRWRPSARPSQRYVGWVASGNDAGTPLVLLPPLPLPVLGRLHRAPGLHSCALHPPHLTRRVLRPRHPPARARSARAAPRPRMSRRRRPRCACRGTAWWRRRSTTARRSAATPGGRRVLPCGGSLLAAAAAAALAAAAAAGDVVHGGRRGLRSTADRTQSTANRAQSTANRAQSTADRTQSTACPFLALSSSLCQAGWWWPTTL